MKQLIPTLAFAIALHSFNTGLALTLAVVFAFTSQQPVVILSMIGMVVFSLEFVYNSYKLLANTYTKLHPDED